MKRGDQQSDFPPDEGETGGISGSRPETHNNGDPDDPVLLEAALRGDIEAFAGLFERYRPSLRAVCLKQLGDPSLVEDVVQEVFIRAFMSLPNYQHRNLFRQWLATIAIRMCIDLQRRRSFTYYTGDIGSSVDADESNGTSNKEAGSALDAVIAAEERAEFWESLEVLTKPQRRAFVLYAVDGWSCADIASAEGISVDAVKHLLFRARRKMRAARQSGIPSLLVFPSTWLRSRLQEAEERVRMLLGTVGERLSSAGALAVSLGILAVITVTASNPSDPSKNSDAIRPDEQVTAAAHSQPLQTGFLFPNVSASTGTPADPQQSATEPARSLVDNLLNPNQDATPENTSFDSITASPNYESDHTILAVGYSSLQYVLFVSHDGGGTWETRASRFLQGSAVVLPPSFPQDGRIFTYGGDLGLQQSDDGGQLFRTVSPVWGQGIAISPSFGRGDFKILMGSRTIFEFDASTGLTSPALLAIPPAQMGGTYLYVAFSPSYSSESTVFVSDRSTPTLYRCVGLICDVAQSPYPGPVRFRSSPRCDLAGPTYAFTPWKLLVSNDGFRTFGEIPFPFEFLYFTNTRSIHDVAIMCHKLFGPAIFVAANDYSSSYPRFPTGIYRSFDVGSSWSRTSIDLAGFGYGAKRLITTPTGRLLAAGAYYGIACSEDFGETWAPRCPPEP